MRRAALGALFGLAVLGAFWWQARPGVQLETACRRLSSGQDLSLAAGSLPAESYRQACCSGTPERCGERPVCALLDTPAGPLGYSCAGEERDCLFLWRWEGGQCAVRADMETRVVLGAEWSDLPL